MGEGGPRAKRGGVATFSLLALVVIVGAGAAGFLLGDEEAAPRAEASRARVDARREAEPTAYREAFTAAEARGTEEGRTRGTRSGRRAGRKAGKAILEERQAEAEEQAAALQTSCPPGQQLLVQMGVQYCGRPGPARPEDCPPGHMPVGETGACAPPDPAVQEPPPDYSECVPGFHYTNEPPGGCVPD